MLIAFIGITGAAWGQAGTTGTILGTITDVTGAVLPGAPIDVTNTATGVTTKVISTGTGDYTVPNLIPGPYKVSAQMAGFSKSVVSGIVLVVAQAERVNLQLKAGETTETVEVSAGAVALDTDSSSVSQIVSEQQMSQLPINGRNFTSLLFVGAGAVQTVGEQGQMRSNEGDAISINGSRPESNNYTLDGLTNTDTALNTPAVILSQDAIQEFKVQSATYSAEYGFSANQVNIVSKSGGNQYHGSVFEFLRNDFMNAIPHQSVSNNSDKAAEWRDNQFGYVLDGPVSIPKLYNGKDKTFFLANYEGRRAVLGGRTSGSAPTAAELGGDFTALSSSLPYYMGPAVNGATCGYNLPGQTTDILPSGKNCAPVDPQTGKPFTSPISSSRFSKMAQVTTKLIPTAATDANGGINWFATANATTNTDQQTYRLDQAFQKWGQIFFRYTRPTTPLRITPPTRWPPSPTPAPTSSQRIRPVGRRPTRWRCPRASSTISASASWKQKPSRATVRPVRPTSPRSASAASSPASHRMLPATRLSDSAFRTPFRQAAPATTRLPATFPFGSSPIRSARSGERTRSQWASITAHGSRTATWPPTSWDRMATAAA